MDYSRLPTEMQNPKTAALDKLPVKKILELMDREDALLPRILRKLNLSLVRAVRIIVNSLKKGGRLIFVGAGTSGRLGVIEAAECPPTFGTPPGLVQAVMAGGRAAVFRSKEGSEDQVDEARRAIRKKVRRGDVVIGISASGVTPFVGGALQEAKRIGARTILIASNLATPLRSKVDVLLAPRTGAEVIAGSTRLKAGTATKMILNRLTVASMIQLGKVYGNWMVDLRPSSRKLRARALGIVKRFTGSSDGRARTLLAQARGRVKTAILMGKKNFSYTEALRVLRESDGFLRKALGRR